MEAGQEGPWHSSNSDIYHDNPGCQSGRSIAPENVRRGTGGNRPCEECARLNRAAGSVAGPVDAPTGGPAGGGREEDLVRREAARSQTAGAAHDPLA